MERDGGGERKGGEREGGKREETDGAGEKEIGRERRDEERDQ